MCPEKSQPQENKDKVLLGYTHAVDAWALGVLAYELIVGHPPFERETRTDTYEQIMYRRPHYPAMLSEGPRSFISAALTKVCALLHPQRAFMRLSVGHFQLLRMQNAAFYWHTAMPKGLVSAQPCSQHPNAQQGLAPQSDTMS